MRRKKSIPSAEANGFGSNTNGFSSDANGFSSDANGFSSNANGFGSNASGFSSNANGFSSNANGFGGNANTQKINWQPYDELIIPDKPGMCVALICGGIGLILGLIIYAQTALSSILKIGILAALAAGLPLVGLYAYAKCCPEHQRTNESGLWVMMCALLLLFGCGCLMQFLYNLTAEVKDIPIDDYVFVIDDSGSMATTDPQGARVTSLNAMLADMSEDKRIGLISFTGDITMEIPLDYATQQHKDYFLYAAGALQNYGGTDIQRAITYALNMDGVSDSQRTCMLVLLTDGASQTYVSSRGIASLCTERNAVISTIGLSNQVDAHFLQRIAGMTGGTFYGTDELDQLAKIYTQVSRLDSNRDLIGIRNGSAHDSLGLGALRVFSWLLFAVIEGIAALLIVRDTPKPFLLGACCVVCGLVLGTALELLSALWWSGLLMRAVLLLLPGILVLYYSKRIPIQPSGNTVDQSFFGGSMNRQEQQHDLRTKEDRDTRMVEFRKEGGNNYDQ